MTRGSRIGLYTAAAVLLALTFGGYALFGRSGRHDRPEPGANAEVFVQEDVGALPRGSVVHLCLRDLPCQTDVVRSERGVIQGFGLHLPVGVQPQRADGWPLHAFAAARGVIYTDRTRVIYHISVDPPCHCAGDYAYVRLGRS